MLVIRSKQMNVLRIEALRMLEDDMVVHAQSFASRHCEVIGEEMVRQAVNMGIDRAVTYGFVTRGAVRTYIEMMLILGSAFDTDPQVPWAGQILRSASMVDPLERAERLYERTLDYLEKVGGPGNRHTLRALRDIQILAAQLLTMPASNQELVEVVLAEMARVYPTKYDYVGELALRTLVDAGIRLANDRKMGTMRGRGLLCVLMFATGHGCADDPLFPWIGRTLTDDRLYEADKRAAKLEARALAYLDRALTYFVREGRHV